MNLVHITKIFFIKIDFDIVFTPPQYLICSSLDFQQFKIRAPLFWHMTSRNSESPFSTCRRYAASRCPRTHPVTWRLIPCHPLSPPKIKNVTYLTTMQRRDSHNSELKLNKPYLQQSVYNIGISFVLN